MSSSMANVPNQLVWNQCGVRTKLSICNLPCVLVSILVPNQCLDIVILPYGQM